MDRRSYAWEQSGDFLVPNMREIAARLAFRSGKKRRPSETFDAFQAVRKQCIFFLKNPYHTFRKMARTTIDSIGNNVRLKHLIYLYILP